MNWLNFFDDVGINALCRPIGFILDLQILNLMDDLGTKFFMKPLGYFERVAELLVGG